MARDVVVWNDRFSAATIAAGAIAGMIGGILMAAFAMMYAGLTGMGFLAPLLMIGATFYGPQALVGGAGVMLYGLILHMMTSAVWGVIFAVLLPRGISAATATGWGVLFGLVVAVVMYFGVVPWANPTMYSRVPMMIGAFVVEHLLFGAGLGLTPVLEHRATARPVRI
jgi:hypothetical protein